MQDVAVEDVALHRRLVGGDREAFDELYRRYSGIAYGLARRLTADGSLAQDVVHDAYLALWRAPEAYDPDRGAFRTFLLALVHHRAVDVIRREERMRARDRESREPRAVGERRRCGGRDRGVVPRRPAPAGPGGPRRPLARINGTCSRWPTSEARRRCRSPMSCIPLGTVKTRTFAALRKLRAALEETE